MPLNIGYDAKRAFHNKTGLGNYSRLLISGMDHFFPENQYFLFTKNPRNDAFESWSETLHHTNIITPQGSGFEAYWRSMTIPRLLQKHNCSIYHGLSAELPIGRKPKNLKYIVTIHDLIFIRFPKLYPYIDRQIYFSKSLHACHHADRIIAISEQTKRDIINYLSIPEEKVTVITQTCDPIFEEKWHPNALQEIQLRYNLPDRYILNVGTLEERKNALIILKALIQLDKTIHAVFVGRKTAYQTTLDEYIRINRLEDRVHFIDNLIFKDLPGIYQLADVFIYPSIFEGLGMPIIEAIKSEVPVIAATGSCLEEAGGPGGIYIHPEDSDSLKVNVERLMNDTPFRQRHIATASRYGERFSLEQFANNMMALYHTIGNSD